MPEARTTSVSTVAIWLATMVRTAFECEVFISRRRSTKRSVDIVIDVRATTAHLGFAQIDRRIDHLLHYLESDCG